MPDPTPLRVIYVLERFPGPTVNFVYNEIRGLEAAGVRVDVYSLLPGSDCPREAEDFLERTRNIRPVGFWRLARSWMYYVARRPARIFGLKTRFATENGCRTPRKIVKTWGHLLHAVHFAWLIRDRDEHIHAHFAFKAATAALTASRLNGNTFSFTAHGSATVNPPSRFSLRSKIRGARFVVAVSGYNKRVMHALCPDVADERIFVNRTGILPKQFAPKDGAPTTTKPFRIICVATLYPVKNHATLLRACGRLRRDGLDFVLDLVGRDDLGLGAGLAGIAREEGIDDRVIFHGSVDHGRIAGMLQDANVCILTSRVEGVPVSLMEAMASGIPVIGPNITGVPELIINGETGTLVEPSDPADVARALVAVASGGDDIRRMAQAAREHVAAEFDMEKNARSLAMQVIARLQGGEDVARGA